LNSGPASHDSNSGTPLSDRVCDGVAVWFAVWTVCAHAVVAAGGNLNQLLAVFAFAAVLVAGALFGLSRRAANGAAPETFPPPAARARVLWILQFAGLAIGVGLVFGAVATNSGLALWRGVVGLLGFAAALFLLGEPPFVAPPSRGRWNEIALWAMALFGLIVALIVHRPDLDDAFYVNIAVAAADFPGRALLSGDTMLGVENLPLHMPAHRIHTYELWNGALSYVTGMRAIYAFHWFSAGMFALLIPLAHAKLFRLLTPRVWPWAVAAVLVVLLGAGETHRWYGNFAFVRIWQGKGIYLFVFMPLVYSYAIQFALRPSLPRWGLLLAAQTAAVGCSSSAVWAAPVGAFTALCCVVRPTPEGLRRFLLGALASAYAMGVGFLLKGELQGLIEPMTETHASGAQVGNALRTVLGSANLWLFGVVAVPSAWACCGRGLAQRFAIAVPLAVWLVLLNPYITHWVTANLTGPSFWRSMWSLPVPILMALILISPLHLARGAASRVASGIACIALCATFLAVIPAFGALSERNGGSGGVGIRVGRQRVKAPEGPYRWAAALNAAVPTGAVVVAPPDIGLWVTTFHDHAHPLQTRKLYLGHHRAHLGEEDVKLRMFMTQYAGGGGEDENAGTHFARGLEAFDVKGVLLRNSGRAVEARAILERLGFERTLQAVDHEIWVRP
jgi:hypothetical protein